MIHSGRPGTLVLVSTFIEAFGKLFPFNIAEDWLRSGYKI